MVPRCSVVMNNTDTHQLQICKNCPHSKKEHRYELGGPRFYDHHCLCCKCQQFTL
jgi:hypothetical protein